MSYGFKVQKITQPNTLLKNQKTKNKETFGKNSLGQVIISIPTIPILKYSSHALIQILSSFFDNDQTLPSYHQVQKALQIVTLTTDDDMLFSDIQSLILKNIHKKKDIYVFFCLWSQYLSISEIIEKFSNQKTKEKIIYIVLFVYLSQFSSGVTWYQNLSLKDQIGEFVSSKIIQHTKTIDEIDAQLSYFRPSNSRHSQSIIYKLIKLDSLCTSTKFQSQLHKILVNFIKNAKNFENLDQIVKKFIDKNSQNGIISSMIQFFQQNNLKQANEILKNSINKGLNNKFNSENNQTFFCFVQQIFQKSRTQKSQHYLKDSFINWLISIDSSLLWKFFNGNFDFKSNFIIQAQKNKIMQKRILLFNILSELSKQNQKVQKQVQKIIYCQYIFQFFEGKSFNFSIQSQFLQKKSEIKFENERQTLIKVLRGIKNQKFLNVLFFNKSIFPPALDWSIDQNLKQMTKKYSSISSMKKLLSEVNEHWQKLESDVLRENKKIELMFSVLRVSIDKMTIFVTVSQLGELLKEFYQGKGINLSQINQYLYRSEYEPVQSKQEIKKNKSILINKQKEIHPIIIEAKIVKLLKKTLKKATVNQISKAINFDRQKTYQSVKKLVTKGFLQENQDETYSYQP